MHYVIINITGIASLEEATGKEFILEINAPG